MNVVELGKLLVAESFRSDAYSLCNDLRDNTLCLENNLSFWSVYYFERGSKFYYKEFREEKDACEYLLQLIRSDPSTKMR